MAITPLLVVLLGLAATPGVLCECSLSQDGTEQCEAPAPPVPAGPLEDWAGLLQLSHLKDGRRDQAINVHDNQRMGGDPEPGVDIAAAPANSCRVEPGTIVAFKGGRSGKYLRDSPDGLTCDSDSITDSNKFEIGDAGDGMVTLRGGAGFCCNEVERVICNRERARKWEYFLVGQSPAGITLRSARDKSLCIDTKEGVRCTNAQSRSSDPELYSLTCLGKVQKVAPTAPATAPPTAAPTAPAVPVPAPSAPTSERPAEVKVRKLDLPAPVKILAKTGDESLWGWEEGTKSVGGDGNWCKIAVPPDSWTLKAECTDTEQVRVLNYNLFWWRLFGQLKGADRSAAKLIAAAHKEFPFDFMGFQECDDMKRLLEDLKETGLGDSFKGLPGAYSVGMAYRADAWELLQQGWEKVAEDEKVQYYGLRPAIWARFRSKKTGRTVFFMNHHGPLRVGSGGRCGGEATGWNIMKAIATRARKSDFVILVGDFNAEKSSGTYRTLSTRLVPHFTGNSFGGVDHIMSNCETALVSNKNLGPGGSDHDALSSILQF